MKSFPSAFNKNPAVSTGLINLDIKNLKNSVTSSLKNIGSAVTTKMLQGSNAVTIDELGDNLDFTLYQDKYFLNNSSLLNYANNNEITNTSRLNSNNRNASLIDNSLFNEGNVSVRHRNENVFKLPSTVLQDVNKYSFTFKTLIASMSNNLGKSSENDKSDDIIGEVFNIQGSPSLFNPLFAVHTWGLVENIPLTHNINDVSAASTTTLDGAGNPNENGQSIVTQAYSKETDVSDCTIKTLVKLSREAALGNNGMGRCQYKYADFMYCKELGKISNNYLITLRKFAHPIGDNIWTSGEKGISANSPDIGRMVTWLGENNKLEDICKYEYNATWKKLDAKIQEKQSQEENTQDRGIVGSISQVFSPKYNLAMSRGIAGSGNMIYGWLANSTTLGRKFLSNRGTYENHECLGNYDQNRVYEPTDTIQDTHIYEGKLQFNQEFTLVFTYKLRAYDNINPKNAALDLIANILQVTYRKGKFWGGAKQINGSPSPSNKGYDMTSNFINQAWDKLGGFLSGILSGNINFNDIMASVSNFFGGAYDEAKKVVDGVTSDPKGTGKAVKDKVVEYDRKTHISDAFKGMLKNKLGRPAMYAFNSLLSDDDVGLWHVTIGNPRNPIMSFGNLILMKSSIQHSGPLGIDDFPTEIKVTVTLKHAKSRDATGIAQMYTRGQNSIYMPLTNAKLEKYLKIGETYATDLGNTSGETTDSSKASGNKVTKALEPILGANRKGSIYTFGTRKSDEIIYNAASSAPTN